MPCNFKGFIEGIDYFVYWTNMPQGIFACVVKNPDCTFSIYLDPRRSRSQLFDDLDHELDHIKRDDFYNGLPIQVVENL